MGTLAVLDPAEWLPSCADYTHDWLVRQVPPVTDPRCDLPPPKHYLREWFHPERVGVTRCHMPPDHLDFHFGLVVTRKSTTGEVGTPMTDALTVYQWPRSEADAPSGDRP